MRWARHALLLVAAAGLGLAVRSVRLEAVESYRSAQRYEDVYYLPRADLLPVLSLGYAAALADLIWCKSLVYFGEDMLQRGKVRHVFSYTDAILALDPSFREAYRWAATAALYRPAAFDMNDGLHAASYLARAVQRWPDDGELHWDYGSLLRFELAPMERDADRKRDLLERAAPELELAARMGAGPPWLAFNSADLLNKLGRSEQAIRHLEEVRATTQDPALQRELDQRLDQLRTHTYLESIEAAGAQQEAARKASYPYLSPALFMWVGAPPAPGSYERFVSQGFTDESSTQ